MKKPNNALGPKLTPNSVFIGDFWIAYFLNSFRKEVTIPEDMVG